MLAGDIPRLDRKSRHLERRWKSRSILDFSSEPLKRSCFWIEHFFQAVPEPSRPCSLKQNFVVKSQLLE